MVVAASNAYYEGVTRGENKDNFLTDLFNSFEPKEEIKAINTSNGV